MERTSLLFLFVLTFTTTASGDQSIETAVAVTTNTRNDDPYRLPRTVFPEHYELVLRLDEDFGSTGVYTGSVKINVYTTTTTQEIILHSKYLNINETQVYLTCNQTLYPTVIVNLSDYEMISLVLPTGSTPIPSESNCVLEFGSFTGVLGDDMYGFYRSYYTDENNQTV